MVLIFSSGIHEASTDKIIDYLSHNGVEFYKISPIGIAFENQISIEDDTIFLHHKGRHIILDPQQIKAVWLRKWNVENEMSYYLGKKNVKPENIEALKKMYTSETEAIGNFIFDRLTTCKWYPKPTALFSNKLMQMSHARAVGFQVPHSRVASVGETLNSTAPSSITKLINTHFSYTHKNKTYHAYTNTYSPIDSDVFPSLIQEKIEKEIELRVFYFDGEIRCTAILSQEDERTSVDYRRYDYQHVTRIIPYEPEPEITFKIEALMKRLDINTGSLDFILTTEGDLYFLEVNPFGQFGLHSRQCNLEIEALIAKKLCHG